MQVLITIPDDIYAEVSETAKSLKRPVEEFIGDAVVELFKTFPRHENHVQMAQEMVAYEKMHPELWQQYPHQFVAVMGGSVIDHDSDLTHLALRIEANHPDEVVLLEEVLPTLPPVLHIRSPRFL